MDDDNNDDDVRRYIGAVIQHITYNEWLPIILGPRVLEIFELRLLARGHYRGYNDSVNPTIANSFAAAAFRYLMSTRPSILLGSDYSYEAVYFMFFVLFS